MGVFQSVGGASTSGKSLNDAHLRAAILTALQASTSNVTDRRREFQTAAAEGKAASSVLSDAEYTAHQESQVNVGGSSPDASNEELHVSEYAPDVFSALRHLCGLQNEDFINEWSRSPDARQTTEDGLQLGEGRSGASFLKSKSMAFMCKTISETEVDVLLGLLKQYLVYLETNPDSMLMRFVMLLKVTLKGEVGYILCFSDCFSNCDVLHERWDLKGRKPKPGKFRHFPGHELQQNKIVSDKEKAKNGKKANIRTADSRQALKLLTYKDKNLARLFWVEPQTRSELIAQLTKDFEFLGGCGLMDYSILIGVRYNTPEETVAKEIERDAKLAGKAKSPNGGSAMRQTFAMGEEGQSGAYETRPGGKEENLASTQRVLANINSKLSKFHSGVENIECGETYFIGIIDMLTVYNAKKMTANFCKSFLWRENTLSTIPPKAYRRRIQNFSHQIFPLVDVTDEAFQGSSPIKGKHDNLVRVASIRRKNETTENAHHTDDEDHHHDVGDNFEPTELHNAARKGDADLIKKLIQRQAPVNAKDDGGMTPLIIAVEKDKAAAALVLLDAKVDANATDRMGRSSLHYAAINGNVKITNALISAGVDVDARDTTHCSALHHAVENYNHNIMKILIEAKCNVNLADEEGMTPLKCALANEDAEAESILRAAGAVETVKSDDE